MAEAALIMQGASALAGGAAAMGKARGEKQLAETNAYIGRTRALQTGTSAMDGLTSELASMRTVMAGNDQKAGVGTFGMFQELRRIRGRERRIGVGNENAAAADWRMRGKNAMAVGRADAVTSVFKAGQSMFDLAQMKGGG